MSDKPTLKELAKKLKVSVSTVSKALNDSNEISSKTKKRVKELALLYNYAPNELAKGLKSRKTKTIGVIIPNILSHFFAESLHSIETTASKMGYKIIICISNESISKESESIKTLINGSVDGIIMSLARETQAKQDFDHFKQAMEYGIPFVLFDRISDTNCDKITINDSEVSRKATEELFISGCRDIIFLSTIYHTSVDQQRQKGYMEEMEKIGLTARIVQIENYDSIGNRLYELLDGSKIDGILASDELSAVTAMKTVLNYGFKIPEDISVIGFTNGVLGENFIPSLTSIDQFSEVQGSTAVETIIGRIEQTLPAEPRHEVINTSIVHRDSTKNPQRS